MKHKKITQQNIEDISRRIAEKFQPEKIILFGSHAWGTPGPDSDIDLFVVKETENTRTTAREIDGFLWGRTFPMDIIVYTPEGIARSLRRGNFFVKHIINNGKTLYDRKLSV